MRAFLLAIAAFALASCASGANGEPESEPLSFTIDQGPCFGFCPVYAITVSGDDSFVLDNRRHTRSEGRQTGQLEAGSFAEIVSALDAVEFRDLPEELTFANAEGVCPGPQISDMPYFEFTARYADGDTVVRWYQGCNYPGMRDFLERVRAAYDYERRIERARE